VAYQILIRPAARHVLEGGLTEGVAAAVWEFIRGPLAENPQRVGKAMRNEKHGLHTARRGSYRVIYRIHEKTVVVEVVKIAHRRDAYR
jgi:mRNA interferase RelE/StbE